MDRRLTEDTLPTWRLYLGQGTPDQRLHIGKIVGPHGKDRHGHVLRPQPSLRADANTALRLQLAYAPDQREKRRLQGVSGPSLREGTGPSL